MASPSRTTLLLLLLEMACITVHVSMIQAQNTPQDFVDAHNKVRAGVGVGPVAWDETVATYAQDYANQRAVDCQMVHSGSDLYGENLFSGWGKPYSAADAVESWAAEVQYYDYNSNSCASGETCGHYTQVVWRNSTSIGCAAVTCDGPRADTFITCNYYPPGNYPGEWPY